PTFAKITDRPITIRRAADIDLPADPPSKPFPAHTRRIPSDLRYFTNEFMPRNAAKRMVAVQNLHIRIADTRHPDPHKRPVPPQRRYRRVHLFQFAVGRSKRQHVAIVTCFPEQLSAGSSR